MAKLGAEISGTDELFGTMDSGNVQQLVDEEFNPWVGKEAAFGQQFTGQPQHKQLVHAYRLTPWGEWELEMAVIHKVWTEADIVTVQFLSDQHRHDLPFKSVKPVVDITPQYPRVRLAPGERMPTRAEIEERERRADNIRMALGLPPDAPLPGTAMEDRETLRPEETMENGRVVMKIPRWGMPGTTLDALRNRSIPGHQVGAVYGRHFYTTLYQKKFYPQAERRVRPFPGEREPQQTENRVVGHRYVPAALPGQPDPGPELVQDMASGDWYAWPEGYSPEKE